MALAQLDTMRKVFDRVRDDANNGDGDLLTRYRTTRDQDAFGSLVRRHGPMVLGVCNRVLRDSHAADDAFQATFLVLARKADTVRPPDRLGPWLYGVAYRTAMKARGRSFRRQQVEQQYATEVAGRTPTATSDADLLPVIDEQLNALPEKYRTPLVLCAVQGLNKAEAAERLGLPECTVSSRLARAREMLRDRLTRRGVIVPAAALAALLTADALQAAVPPALAVASTEIAVGAALVPTTVLTLSNEVLRSMTLLKLKTLCAVALSVTLAGGGFGVYTLSAEDKKPAVQPGEKPAVQPVKPGEKPAVKPDGEKPKPGEKPAVKPDGEKPAKPALRTGGRVASVDAKANTIMLAAKGDGGVVEKLYPLAPGAKITVDGKEAKLEAVPKNAYAAFATVATKDGMLPQITELRVTGPSIGGVVKQVDATSITLAGEKADRVLKLAADGKVTVAGKDAKLADIKAGDKVAVTLAADESAALTISTGTKPGDGEKPGVKPEKAPKFGGKITAVDATAKTVTISVGKGDAVKETVVKLAADAKITIDGKAAKIADLVKGTTATFTIAAAKDGQPREASEVIVSGTNFTGVIKQLDATSITIGGEKNDRVVKLAAGGKVMVGEKEGKLGDLKAGDKVTVTLSSDESAAVLIVSGGAKPVGDKPKPEKE